MPKRPQSSRYSSVATQEEGQESSVTRVASSTSPNVARSRTKNTGQRTHPSSPRKGSQHQEPTNTWLQQLLKCCKNHQTSCHPGYIPPDDNEDAEIPQSCTMSIQSLGKLLPKVEGKIEGGFERKTDAMDILHLCRFYDDVVNANFCPHLTSLFGFERDPGTESRDSRGDLKTILEKVVYLLRNSMNVDLDWSVATASNGKRDSSNGILASDYFDVISRTISKLFSLADISNKHVRRRLFVDWIDFAEDIALLSTQNKNQHFLPVQLALFDESSVVIQQHQETGNENGFGIFSLEISQWTQVRILQIIALEVLKALTAEGSVVERLETKPERVREEPTVLLGGDDDTFFPSGIVTDMDIASTLLASLKPVMMMRSSGNRADNEPLGWNAYPRATATAVQIFQRLCLDWHRLAIPSVLAPLLPCTINAAIVTAWTVQNVLMGHEVVQDSDEKRLAHVLDLTICHPPGHVTNDSGDDYSIGKSVHSAVWTILLDCLEGIAARLRLRQQRNIQEYDKHKLAALDDTNATTPSSTCASSILLDLAVLDTIHYIAATTPALALDGSNYCTARGFFPLLLFLSSSSSLPCHIANDDWKNHSSLHRAANQSLVIFIHASFVNDANCTSLLDNLYNEVLNGRCILSRPDGLEQDGVAGRGAKGSGNMFEETSGVTALKNAGNINDCGMQGSGEDTQDGRHSLKRKRQSSMPQHRDGSVSTSEISGTTMSPVTWHHALRCILDLALDAGINLRGFIEKSTSKKWEHDRVAVRRIAKDLRVLSGGFCLSLSLTRKLSTTAGTETECLQVNKILQVTNELSVQLVSVFDMFLKTIDNLERPHGDVAADAVSRRALSYMMADVVLECGLSMHFSKSENSSGWDTSFIECVASFGGKLMEFMPSRHFDHSTHYKFAGMPVYFSAEESRDVFGPWNCLDVSSQLRDCKEEREWLFDRSITTLNSLPLFVRAALMLSLHPVEMNLFSDVPKEKDGSPCGNYSLNLIAGFFNRFAEKADEIESTDASRRIASLMHLLPLVIASLGKGASQNRIVKPPDALLREALSPVIRVCHRTNAMIFQSLVFAINKTLLLINDKTIGSAFTKPTDVVNLMSVRHLPLRSLESTKDELRGMMADVATKGLRNDENPMSRYFLWMCAASFCVNASPSEILSFVQNASADSKMDEADEYTFRRSNLLPWLVAASFSDPDAFLRKFVSRELPTLFVSEDYSFLLSRFGSSEDLKEYYAISERERKEKTENAMYALVQMSDHVIKELFKEIDGLLDRVSLLDEGEGMSRPNNELGLQLTIANTLSSLCYNATLDHPVGRTLFEMVVIRMIRMWATRSPNMKEPSLYPELDSTPASRALTFGRLFCLSRSRTLASCLSGEESWTYFPSAPFYNVLLANCHEIREEQNELLERIIKEEQYELLEKITKADKDHLLDRMVREEQYQLLERMIWSFFVYSRDSLHRNKSAQEALEVVTQSIPSTIAQLLYGKDEETIKHIVTFRIFLEEKCDTQDVATRTGIHAVGVKTTPTAKTYRALSMDVGVIRKETRTVCVNYIEKLLPLVLLHSDEEEALALEKLISPATIADMISDREKTILKGIAWELGRDPYRLGSAVYALKYAAKVHSKGRLGVDESAGENAAKLWVTENFMYLIVQMVQLNWRVHKTAHKVQALRCLHELLDFLNAAEAPQYLPQVLSVVNSAITQKRTDAINDADDSSLRLIAVRCLSKLIRLSARDSIESVLETLTTIVVSLLPILGEHVVDGDGILDHEARNEAASMLEFLTKAEFVRKYPRAFSQIPFLPTNDLLANVHASLRDNGINFDDLLVLSASTPESQALTLSRRESTGESIGMSASSMSITSGDNFLALQNRIGQLSSLLYDENADVRKVALGHLVDSLRANRNLFHILVENESRSSVKNFLTKVYERNQNASSEFDQRHADNPVSNTVSNIIEILMQRCVLETDKRFRLELARCLGEIGAIGEYRLDDMSRFRPQGNGSTSMSVWRRGQPPWQSRVAKYELQLVTECLVAALKAAPSQKEQVTISFTIQQFLLLLDASVKESNGTEVEDQPSADSNKHNSKKPEMSKWLRDRLKEADVYESVGPFWLSEYQIKDEKKIHTRQPPFFNESESYNSWIAEFCLWMIWKAKNCPLSRWKDFFFACRLVVRSEAGLEAAEFILPLLVLDRICFGSVEEFESICQEFLMILDFDSNIPRMDSSERQKTACGFFPMIETLQYWAEIETELRYRSKKSPTSRRSSSSSARRKTNEDSNDDSSSNWPADNAITKIKDLIDKIPLINQARAATKVGMHAKGLRLLELVARKNIVEDFFESSSGDKTDEISLFGNLFQQSLLKNVNIDLMKSVLSNLNDCETLNAIGDTSYPVNPLLQVTDSIQWKEASGDFEGALRDYHRATQLRKFGHLTVESSIERGELDCMLQLGHFESVLSRATGEEDKTSTKAFALEAATRLGKWDKLSELVSENENRGVEFCPRDAYRQATAKAFLCLRDSGWESLGVALRTARTAVMDSLSIVARESYSRAYTDIARLQSITELEDAGAFFSSNDDTKVVSLSEQVKSTLPEGWAWEGRLKLTAPRASSSIMSTRVAIARLGKDPVMESSLLLDIGKQAFDNGMHTAAEKFYSQAESVLLMTDGVNSELDSLLHDIRVHYASLKKASGENLLGLKIVGQGMVQSALIEMNRKNEDIDFVKRTAVKYERERAEALGIVMSVGNDRKLIDRFTNRLLRLTQWTVEAGMQSGNEIMASFQTVIKLSPKWEKGHFEFAKYLNELIARFVEKDSFQGLEEDVIRFHAFYREEVCHKYALLAIEHYATTLRSDTNHVYQALPRLLSLWFDFVSLESPVDFISVEDDDSSSRAMKSKYLDLLEHNQDKANVLMANNIKAIPASVYYTAMPQLISRVIHKKKDTADIVRKILERVLYKFPHQAMWNLAWLRGSKKRKKIGDEIFKNATIVLKNNSQLKAANLLKASESLFDHLQNIARFQNTKDKNNRFTPIFRVQPWKGKVDLSEFIPPVQAALSSPFKPVKNSSKDYYPRVVPRMRAFSSKVSVMSSKERPKRITAFAVPGTWKHANARGSTNSGERPSLSSALDCDIGEIHFLVKQERKGDLRKDARVQDLNNVINRLMTSSNNSNSTLSSKSRRLRVRTFAVTCLSEDTGILEWVPDTSSLGSLVYASYNTQVSSFCDRGRGSKMNIMGNVTLKRAFEAAQNKFLKDGKLAQATEEYYKQVLRRYPPVLSWWFIQNFRSATDWYEARLKFALTAAAWSAIGHVIGLGDRHTANILVETTTGRMVHIDFDCIFDKALKLAIPEIVPFRLTPNMLDAFGPTGADGIFRSGMESSFEILRQNRETLLSVLEPFIKDPVIDWTTSKAKQTISSDKIPVYDAHSMKEKVNVIKERLSGICNLQNPNYEKLIRRGKIDQDIRNRAKQDKMTEDVIPLSVEGQVQKLCAEASKNENLLQMYCGWTPWV